MSRTVVGAALLALLVPPALVPCSFAATWHVPGQYPTIQPAIDQAAPGDTVLVAAGTYMGPLNVDLEFHGKDIVVRSESGPEVTVIDSDAYPWSQHRAFNLHSGEGSGAVIEGFTLTRGACWDQGGGIYIANSSPTVKHCILRANTSNGIASYEGSPTIEGCLFTNNGASRGGGFLCGGGAPNVRDCVFSGNGSWNGGDGGALYAENTALEVAGCRFEDNYCYGAAGGSGGAIACYSPSGGGPSPTIRDCVFRWNCADQGGGLHCRISSPNLIRCEFYDGRAKNYGGGGVHVDLASPTITDCAFWRNEAAYGGGLHVQYGTVIVQGSTFAENEAALGSGIYSTHQYSLTLDRTIIAFGTGGEALAIDSPSGDHLLACCDLFGNAGGDWVGEIADQLGVNGNFSADPLFCNMPIGDLHLDAMSPCLDAPGCGLIGAWGEGCGSRTSVSGGRTEPVTWGQLKDRAGRGE